MVVVYLQTVLYFLFPGTYIFLIKVYLIAVFKWPTVFDYNNKTQGQIVSTVNLKTCQAQVKNQFLCLDHIIAKYNTKLWSVSVASGYFNQVFNAVFLPDPRN